MFFLQSQAAAITAFERRQMRLTTTMCTSCLLTTVLYVAPLSTYYFINNDMMDKLSQFLLIYTPISCNLNPLAIIVTIFVMQDDIREAILTPLPQRLRQLLPKKYAFGGSKNIFTTNNQTSCERKRMPKKRQKSVEFFSA